MGQTEPSGSVFIDQNPGVCLQDAGSQQIGFLLGSCGVTVALTSDACLKGLPKSPTGEVQQFKGQPVCTLVLSNVLMVVMLLQWSLLHLVSGVKEQKRFISCSIYCT